LRRNGVEAGAAEGETYSGCRSVYMGIQWYPPHRF
jgi:hypothetical protein